MHHKVVGHGGPVILHVRAENTLAHKVDGPHHEEHEDDAYDGANDVDGLGGWLFRGIWG